VSKLDAFNGRRHLASTMSTNAPTTKKRTPNKLSKKKPPTKAQSGNAGLMAGPLANILLWTFSACLVLVTLALVGIFIYFYRGMYPAHHYALGTAYFIGSRSRPGQVASYIWQTRDTNSRLANENKTHSGQRKEKCCIPRVQGESWVSRSHARAIFADGSNSYMFDAPTIHHLPNDSTRGLVMVRIMFNTQVDMLTKCSSNRAGRIWLG
jgi:hypothetical protein